MSKSRLGWLYRLKRVLFRNSGAIEPHNWPLILLVDIVVFRHDWIREFCAYCNDPSHVRFLRTTTTGDSGGICQECLEIERAKMEQEFEAEASSSG